MARIDPLPDSELGDLLDMVKGNADRLGFDANSHRTMARLPKVYKIVAGLGAAVFGEGTVSPQLKFMMSLVVSRAAGCGYCQAHTGFIASNMGVSPEKEAALWEFETSSLFSDAERAALTVALGAGHAPNAVSDADFDELKKHYSDDEIAEIVAVLAYMGWTNRWNDTMATELESSPLNHAQESLTQHGWEVGKHRA